MNRITAAFLCILFLFVILILPAGATESEVNGSESSSSVVTDGSSETSSDEQTGGDGASSSTDSTTSGAPSDSSSEISSEGSSDTSGSSSEAASGDGSSVESTSSDAVSSADSGNTSSDTASGTTSDTGNATSSEDTATSVPSGSDSVPPVTLPSDDGYLIHFKDDKITVKAPEDAFSDGVIMSVTELLEGNNYLIAKNVLASRVDKFSAFRITAAKDGVAAVPSSAVRLNITVPEDYDPQRVAVLFITATGGIETVQFVIGENNTADADIKMLGTVVIAELKQTAVEPSESQPTESGPENGDTLTGALENETTQDKGKEAPKWVSVFLLAAAVVLIGGGAIAGIIVERLRLIK